jgi:hypothetical protein
MSWGPYDESSGPYGLDLFTAEPLGCAVEVHGGVGSAPVELTCGPVGGGGGVGRPLAGGAAGDPRTDASETEELRSTVASGVAASELPALPAVGPAAVGSAWLPSWDLSASSVNGILTTASSRVDLAALVLFFSFVVWPWPSFGVAPVGSLTVTPLPRV